MTTNHPAHGPVSLERLHQIREILSKAASQSDGGNLGYAMADAVKVIDGAIAAFGAKLDENGLLPCPLCGGGAEFDYDDDNLNWISCSACGISTDTVYHTDIDARDKLREVWNRRTAMLQGGNSPVIGIDLASEPDRSVEIRYFAPPGYVMVPNEMTPEMMRAVQIKSELGGYAASELSGAYDMFSEFWDVAVTSAPLYTAPSGLVATNDSICKYCGGSGSFRWQQSYDWMPCPCKGCTEFAAPQQEVK